MDFNSTNKNNGKRKAQSIQDMINAPSQGIRGIGKSGYTGPKKGADMASSTRVTGNTTALDLNGINVKPVDSANRWGNSNEGMPKEKRPRVKSDVPNPMRGNLFKQNDSKPAMKSSIAGEGSSYSGPKVRGVNPSSFLQNAVNSMDNPEKTESRTNPIDKSRLEKNSDGGNRTRVNSAQEPRRNYVAKSYSTPLDDYGWIIFSALLGFAVFVTLLASGLKPRNKSYSYPLNIFSMTGVINTAYEHALGFAPVNNNDSNTDSSQVVADETPADPDAGLKTVEAANPNDLNTLGDDANAVVLDDGTNPVAGYTPAASHSELVTQIESALAANDFGFIGSKIAYENENSGELAGYPLSLIKHFTEYMATNADKRSSFISTIGAEEYSATNGSAMLIKLPVMKFTVKMGESTDTFVLDNTVVSVSGFSDVIVNGNQQAAIYPLLPCIYTVTLTNNAWPTPSQSQEIEATLGEGNLEIKVGT